MSKNELKQLMKQHMPIFCGKCKAYLGLVKRANAETESQELSQKYGGKCPSCGKALRSSAKKGSFWRALFRRPQT